ncbi:MAG: hypothetical protein VB128_16155 [Sedimentibacter saalensis]|nr:hypothetical protein [Sedimentibacter saalensis]MEA5096486.1 hypothetical protein [Sedimentibacter saalensis]
MMKKQVAIHLIGIIVVSIIGVLECFLFVEFDLVNILKSIATNLIYYCIIIGSGLLLRKVIK